ncbi:hypothetical protein ACFY7V_33950 [[Kitasatospora] papulosa]|uniref:hypothetical protein n=1 Tax=Streptomyces TaxID=1883 RepID=UPI002FEF8DD2
MVDLLAAQDQVNAALCLPHLSPYYRLLSARAVLGLPAAAQELLAQRQADEQRIGRLCFLKKNLYDRPDLVVLDQMERRATGALDEELVGELQRAWPVSSVPVTAGGFPRCSSGSWWAKPSTIRRNRNRL